MPEPKFIPVAVLKSLPASPRAHVILGRYYAYVYRHGILVVGLVVLVDVVE